MELSAVRATLSERGIYLHERWWQEWWARSRHRTPQHALHHFLSHDYASASLRADTTTSPETPFSSQNIARVFQVNEIENVSKSVLTRAKEWADNGGPPNTASSSSSAVWKMKLTDGYRTFVAVEASPHENVNDCALSPGSKLFLKDFELFDDSVIVLTAATHISVLGGCVLSLKAQHDRKWKERVDHVTKRGGVQVERDAQAQVQNGHAALPPQARQQDQSAAPDVDVPVVSASPTCVADLASPGCSIGHQCRVSAVIVGVCAPMQVVHSEYVVEVWVDDGTAQVRATMSPALIQSIIDMPAHDFETLRRESLEAPTDPNSISYQLTQRVGVCLSDWGLRTFILKKVSATQLIVVECSSLAQ